MSLYDFANGDPVNQFDADGRFGKGVISGLLGGVRADDPNSDAYWAGFQAISIRIGFLQGLYEGSRELTRLNAYKEHLEMLNGDVYSAGNAAWNPAYMAYTGLYSAYADVGLRPGNLGSNLGVLDRTLAGVEGAFGVLGTVGTALGIQQMGSMALKSVKSAFSSLLGSAKSASNKTVKALPAPKVRGNPNTAPTYDKIVVDPKGNAIPLKQGESLTGSPDGRFIQVRDANGNPTGLRIDGPHKPASHPDPRAQQPHAHVPGVTNPDGTPWLPINQ